MIILKNETGDFIYLDVVTRYSRNLSSQITQHPVDGAGTTSDNVVIQNPRFQITGNITGADFNSSKPTLTSEDRFFIGIDQIVVESDVATIVEVNYEDSPKNLLPDIAGQFFSDTLPTIDNLNEGRDARYSERVLYEILQNFQLRKEKLSIYDFDNGSVDVSPVRNVFISSLKVNESATTGDALSFDMTLEQITIATLLKEKIPEDVQESFRKKNAEEKKRGEQAAAAVEAAEEAEENIDSTLKFFKELAPRLLSS